MVLHADYVSVFKALGDDTRLKIVEMLSCNELCACDILECFEFTQPTLSYHMKLLTDCGLVKSRKEGSWIRYSINKELIEHTKDYWSNITTEQKNCKDIKEENRCN